MKGIRLPVDHSDLYLIGRGFSCQVNQSVRYVHISLKLIIPSPTSTPDKSTLQGLKLSVLSSAKFQEPLTQDKPALEQLRHLSATLKQISTLI